MNKSTPLQNSIFTQLGLEDLPSEDKFVLMSQMTELVLKRAMLAVADKLESKKLSKDDEKVLMDGTEEERITKILEYVPEFNDIMQVEIEALRKELTELV